MVNNARLQLEIRNVKPELFINQSSREGTYRKY